MSPDAPGDSGLLAAGAPGPGAGWKGRGGISPSRSLQPNAEPMARFPCSPPFSSLGVRTLPEAGGEGSGLRGPSRVWAACFSASSAGNGGRGAPPRAAGGDIRAVRAVGALQPPSPALSRFPPCWPPPPQALSYSHLILATGSCGPFPGKFSQISSLQAAVGAYEAMVRQVTLIHSKIPLADPELLPCVRQEVKEILLQKGVELLLGERVTNLEELPLNEYRDSIHVQTDKGTQLEANLVILCNGIKINSSAYSGALGDKMASNGALLVNDHLQVQGFSNIYAIGDCADVKEPKMAYHAGLHASVVVTNIVNSIKQKPLKTYKPGALTFLLSMGRNDGVGQISGFYVGRLMVRFAKSRDLFISSSWKTMRQTAPS